MTSILRGRVLSFVAEPQGPGDQSAYRYWEDGAIAIGDDGRVVSVGQYEAASVTGAKVVDHRPCLITAGFIDPHIHYPQMDVIGCFAPALMEWLNTYTFVAEQKFADKAHADRVAAQFFDTLIRHGTTTAAAYCSVHAHSADAFFAEAARRNMAMIGGKVMMDRNCPDALRDTAQSGYDDTKAGIEKWHDKGRALYAISPRFAVTSTPEQLDAAGALMREHPDCYVQTHLSESAGEIEYVHQLYPNSIDYTSIYERYRLLGPKTLFGHCIHLSHREVEALAESGSVAVFCPTSNMFLGSGLFDYGRLHQHGVRIGLATDVGGGTSYSLLATMDEAYKVAQLRGQRLDPLMSFYLATLGNARALSLEGTIGSIVPGAMADLAVLDGRATPEMALRMCSVGSLEEELFLLQTCGDDRTIAEVYVAGRAAKSTLADGQ